MLENRNGTLWFFEELYSDHTFGFEVSAVIVPEYNTGFQKLLVLDTPRFGRVLILDNIVQFAEFDEYVYHETMVHTALFSHKEPKRVLIIGGGDLGIAREVLKHKSIESVTIIDIDPSVTLIAREYFPSLSRSALHDSRLTIFHEDASEIEVLFEPGSFDVILMDTTDNVGNAVSLFQGAFTQKVHTLLTENGIIMRLGGSLFLQKNELNQLIRDTEIVFGKNRYSLIQFTGTATYYGGPFGLIMAWKGDRPDTSNLVERYVESDITTKWYSPAVHGASCIIPQCLL